MSVALPFVGREESEPTNYSPGQIVRWVGKPWRRIEVLTIVYHWQGEETYREHTVTVHFGLRRLGWSFTAIVARGVWHDYRDEPQ